MAVDELIVHQWKIYVSVLDGVGICVYGLQVQTRADVTVCSISASPSVLHYVFTVPNNRPTFTAA